MTPTPVWLFRPILWFAAASMLTTILHELAHASAAYALGVRGTLLSYSADLDMTPAQAASSLPTLIRAAGPVFCLALGLLTWFVFKKARDSASGLPLLYLSVFGIGTFFGNLMSTSFVGDFSSIVIALHVPMPVRHAFSALGALALAAIHYRAGREMIRWAPAQAGRLTSVLGLIVSPVVLGTATVILVNWPIRGSSVSARIMEAAFWVFALIGALVAGRDSRSGRGILSPRWADGAVITLVILVVRSMMGGIPFVP